MSPELTDTVVIAEWVDRSYTRNFKTILENMGYNVVVLGKRNIKDILSYKPIFVAFTKTYYGVSWWDIAAKLFFMGVPVFTWGNDSVIPFIRYGGYGCNKCSGSVVPVISHPIVDGISELPNSYCDWRHCITDASPHAMVLAEDSTNGLKELILLEKDHPIAGKLLWLHYHPYPEPPQQLLENWINYIKNNVKPKRPYSNLVGMYGGLVIIGGGSSGTSHNPSCTDGNNPNLYQIKLTALIIRAIYDGHTYLQHLRNEKVYIIRSENDGGHWTCPSGVRDSVTYWLNQWGIDWVEVSTYTDLENLYKNPHGIIVNTHGEAMPIPPSMYSIYDLSTGWDSNYKNNAYQFYREYLYRVVINKALHIEPIGYTWCNAVQNGECTCHKGALGSHTIFDATYYALGAYVSSCGDSYVYPSHMVKKLWQQYFNESAPSGFKFPRACHPNVSGVYSGFEAIYQGRIWNQGWSRHSLFISYGASKLFREVVI